MPFDALVQTRIDPAIKKEASAVLASLGFTMSDAVRLLLTRVAHDKELPFELCTPNAATIAAMEEARRGGGKSYPNIDALMADLNSDD